MKLFELFESVEKVTVDNNTLSVFKNPSLAQIENIINHMIKYNGQEFPHLRGYVNPETNDYYVWDANLAIHAEIARELGLEYTWKNRCDIRVTTQSEIRVDPTDEFLMNTPNVARLVKTLPNFKFESDLPILENNQLLENKSRSCIVVDVQPEYSGVNDGEENPLFEEIIQFVNNQTGPVLMFVNAEDTGLSGDTKQDVKIYWEDSGFDPENWPRVTLVDKGYGYLRAWMDNGVQPNVIIKVIREMYQQRVNDSRQLFRGEDSETYTEDFKKFLGPDFYQVEKILDDPLITDWIEIGLLKKFNNSYIVGGYRDECLREVTLLCDAFNIKYKLIDSLVYG